MIVMVIEKGFIVSVVFNDVKDKDKEVVEEIEK